MPNKRLAGILATEQTTVGFARWLIDQLRAFPAEDGTEEHRTMLRIVGQLPSDLDRYYQHRHTDDPERRSAHTQLCRSTMKYLKELLSMLSKDSSWAPITTEAELAESLRLIGENKAFLRECRGCFCLRRSAVMCEGCWYCRSCLSVHTYLCVCGSRHRSSRRMLHIRDNELRREELLCPDRGRDKPVGMCGVCGSTFTGPPALPRGAHSSDGELLDMCYVCAGSLKRLSCGHFSHHAQRAHDIQHVEDDNRARENIETRSKTVCRKCLESQNNQVIFWLPSKSRVIASSFQEIGSHRTYGVELEFCQAPNLNAIPEAIRGYWNSKQDLSLPHCGVELSSVILQGDEGLQIIRDLCEYAGKNEWAVDARGAYHLHVGMGALGEEAITSVIAGYLSTYDVWRHLVAPSRSKSKYCRQHRTSVGSLVGRPLDDYLRMICHEEGEETHNRRRWLNACCLDKFGTLEVRLHQGTRMADKVINWIKAHLRFVDWCAEIADDRQVHSWFNGLTARRKFLFMAKEVWKDRSLGRWFRQRSLVLHKASPLVTTNKGVALTMPSGDPIVVTQHGERWVVTCGGITLASTGVFSSLSLPALFKSQDQALEVAIVCAESGGSQDRIYEAILAARYSQAAPQF